MSVARERDLAVSRGDSQALIALLESTPLTERLAREHLVMALEGLASSESAPVLQRIAMDNGEGRHVRVAALEALSKLAHPAALGTGLALLSDAPPRVRRATAKLLGALGGDAAERALIRALQEDDSKDARAEAAEALGRFGSKRAVDALGDKLNQKETLLVRQEAALALHQIDTPEARARLEAELRRARPIAGWRIRRWIETMQ
jgi:HEAT repeat protein